MDHVGSLKSAFWLVFDSFLLVVGSFLPFIEFPYCFFSVSGFSEN